MHILRNLILLSAGATAMLVFRHREEIKQYSHATLPSISTWTESQFRTVPAAEGSDQILFSPAQNIEQVDIDLINNAHATISRCASSMDQGKWRGIGAVMTASRWCLIRSIRMHCCRASARRGSPHGTVGLRSPYQRACCCWSELSFKANRQPSKAYSCSSCWIATVKMLCAVRCMRQSSAILHVPVPLPSCSGSGTAQCQCHLI
jgi:hypothetical protein